MVETVPSVWFSKEHTSIEFTLRIPMPPTPPVVDNIEPEVISLPQMIAVCPGSIIKRATVPVPGESVTAFRVAFGVVALIAIKRLFAHGWIDDLYIESANHFTYPGFGWVRPLPGWGMYLLFAAVGALTVCVAAGYRLRLCATLFFVGFTYAELIDRTTYLNHHYWMSLATLLMIFPPLNRTLTVDAWRNQSIRKDTVQSWAVWALRARVGMVYVFAGIAKLNLDWLLNAQPPRIWLYQHGDMPIFGTLLQERSALFVSLFSMKSTLRLFPYDLQPQC